MSRNSKVISVSLPPAIAKEFENMAKSKGKSGLFREMIEVYRRAEWKEEFRKLQSYGAKKARDVKAFTEADIDRLVFEDR